ncbi:MAG: ECF subfamily RNA polymerase sigma-24 subunit [candidate division WS6 bacterium 34_10]|uniref:ECF subfamily RNA polymerase sigma-24 subunit n=1 Tax=candidate division WS6 bacterium 34_10 TaxID=1641389 RepID=A0A101HIZ4_9BACT|nr:MAG: ECF subfamily RNA polymerase sigma-24 subunit [candidate division WS6 bacterium 34_10]
MNEQEFLKFYESNYNIAVGYVYKRVVRWEDVQDIISESFLALWESRKNLTKDNIKNYLYGIIKNKIADYLRNKYKIELNSYSFTDYEDTLEAPKVTKSTIDYTALVLELSKDLKQREADLIRMKYVEKMSFREIAEVLGITINNTKVLHNRTIKKLKKLWEKNL